MEQRHSECSEFLCPDKFYVCDLRTKHKICILAYHHLCFCVFVFLGMLQYSKYYSAGTFILADFACVHPDQPLMPMQ